MSSIRCPQCGLVNFSRAAFCNRCSAPLDASDPELSAEMAPEAVAEGRLDEQTGLSRVNVLRVACGVAFLVGYLHSASAESSGAFYFDAGLVAAGLLGLLVLASLEWQARRLAASEAGARPPREAGPKGIGGWLLLPVIGLALNLISLFLSVKSLYRALPQLDEFTTFGHQGVGIFDLKPMWRMELLLAALLTGFAILILFKIFRRSRFVPALMIAYLVCNAAFSLHAYWTWHGVVADPGYRLVGTQLVALTEMLAPLREVEHEALREVARTLIAAAVWIPYFLVSRRVKATFIN